MSDAVTQWREAIAKNPASPPTSSEAQDYVVNCVVASIDSLDFGERSIQGFLDDLFDVLENWGVTSITTDTGGILIHNESKIGIYGLTIR